ncbi:157_t:CDS:2 [Funneliformis geosporum]|uniref:157_t:CDS:1 n=1 Tax=Funneliformis geosporum TaxID=1117311 RepID=A0A9W4SVQ1_9GLOM|nr:157_t:CDS:2 [Funneliformis geosporum]
MNGEIKLTPEQKKCAEHPLNQKNLVINADPGTGKTEVLKQRVLFIHEFLLKAEQGNKGMSRWQRKVILVLAYGKNIAAEIRAKLNARGLKSSGINDLVIKKQFQEERRIHVLTATQRVEKKQGLISHDEKNQKEDVPYCRYEVNYSSFLNQISNLLPPESKLLALLESACKQDKAKNDLKVETLHLIIKIFGSERTNFTFVGDPKQNIFGFAGAQADIFKLLEDYFPSQTHSVIATSFRLTPEIADFANHFIQKFMTYRSSIQTTKPKTNQKPQIIVIGQELDYQLSLQDLIDIKIELEKNPELKNSNLAKDKIRMKKLEKHMNTILSIINKLDNPATSKAILYRQGEITINDIIRQVKQHFKGSASEKLKEHTANQKVEKKELETNSTNLEFFSLRSFLASCRISENSIFQLAEIVKKIDENLPPNQPLTRDQINEFISRLEEVKNHPGIILSTIHGMKGLEADYVFLIFCDQKVLPKKEKFLND